MQKAEILCVCGIYAVKRFEIPFFGFFTEKIERNFDLMFFFVRKLSEIPHGHALCYEISVSIKKTHTLWL